MTYRGYTISKTHEGYSVKPPAGPAWNEYAVTLAMAMRWVECQSPSRMTLTLTRVSPEIFAFTSDGPYWSDGSPIDARLALAGETLSSIRAQTLDKANGLSYLLISPIAIRNPDTVKRASLLSIGESFSFTR